MSKCVQSTTAKQLMRFVPLQCLYFKSKRSLKVDRATFCAESFCFMQMTQGFTHFTVMGQYLRN